MYSEQINALGALTESAKSLRKPTAVSSAAVHEHTGQLPVIAGIPLPFPRYTHLGG